ncbi:hypothetical protein [Xanthomonas euvesicatoria]|uniref:hypothetical protein n=1 Tax=Xanthomonas euvesicatoria TaxID=456327 RepID=UPI003A0FFFD6
MCLLAAGCSKVQEARFESTAKNWMTTHASDPDSVMFRNTKVVATSRDGASSYFLCGEINAKNRMGGYAGWSRFVVAGTPSEIPDDPSSGMIEANQEETLFQAIWETSCK